RNTGCVFPSAPDPDSGALGLSPEEPRGAGHVGTHARPRRVRSADVVPPSTNEKRPGWGIPCVTACWRAVYPLWANLPRAVFTKRAAAPLVVSARSIAEYNVAAGVWPPGEVQ